jgi:tripartite-type tricarboxylate transporter receptor subunit TctC
MHAVRLFCSALAFATAGAAIAQVYPTKPVRIISPFPPGQATDIMARLVAENLAQSLGQPFLVENRAGAGGALGTEAAAKAAPDGYTLVMGTIGALAIGPALYSKLAYDPVRDFAPISNLGLTPQTLVVSSSSQFRTLKELVEHARATPVDYASSGNGSASHLAMEMFRSAAGVQLNHIPFKGSSEAQTQVLGGQVQIMFDAIPGVAAQIKAGKLRALGIASPERSPFFPEVPTIAEQGYPGFAAVGWIGIVAPARTPEAVLDRLNAEVRRLLAKAEVKERLAALSFLPVGDSREHFAGFIREEVAKWAKVVKESGAKVD